MKLLTAANIKLLKKYPLGSQDSAGDDAKILVKFFCPWNQWTWYATEAEFNEDGDILFFGLVRGHETELGYFTLSELQSVRGPFGLKIERDMHFDGKTIKSVQYDA